MTKIEQAFKNAENQLEAGGVMYHNPVLGFFQVAFSEPQKRALVARGYVVAEKPVPTPAEAKEEAPAKAAEKPVPKKRGRPKKVAE